jgi:hypothetical protein
MSFIEETPYEFELISEDGSSLGVFVKVISSHAKSVSELLKSRYMEVKRISEFQLFFDNQSDSDINQVEFEIDSATSRLVGWRGMDDEFNPKNARLLCEYNPYARRQILHYSNEMADFLDTCVESLLDYAKHELKLSEKQKDGASLRDHLTNLRDKHGITPPQLISPIVNPIVMYVWENFLSLNATRQSGMGVNAISYFEIKAWCDLTGTKISPYELKIIKQLDSVFLEHYNKQSDKESK